MFCNKCGTQLANGATFCPNCGSKQNVQPQQPPVQPQQQYTPPQPQYVPPQQPQYAPPQQPQYAAPVQPVMQSATPHNGSVSFGKAIELFFKNYANFSGRASKSEYWWIVLFNFLVSLVIGWIPVIGWIYPLAVLVPGLAVCVRRLHDAGRSGAYWFMCLIPLAGPIILIVELCKDSVADNEWGKGPQPVMMYNNYNQQPPYNNY